MIYFIRRANGDIKIGTTKNYSHRLIALRAEHGDLTLLTFMDGSHKLEKCIHHNFKHLQHGDSEWFQPGTDLMEFIQSKELRAKFVAEYEKEIALKRAIRVEKERIAKPSEIIQKWNVIARLAEERNTDPVTMIIEELNRADGNVSAAARALGVTHSVIYYHLRNVKIQRSRIVVVGNEQQNGASHD